jgi:hypothetical protein
VGGLSQESLLRWMPHYPPPPTPPRHARVRVEGGEIKDLITKSSANGSRKYYNDAMKRTLMKIRYVASAISI